MVAPMETIGLPLGLGGLAALPFGVAIRSMRSRRLHLDVPTSKAKGAFLGLNELKGARRYRSRFSKRYSSVFERSWRNLVPSART